MEQHVTELAVALARAGVDVIVFSELPVPSSNCYGKRLRDEGIQLVAPGRLQHWARRLEQFRPRSAGRFLRRLDRIWHRFRAGNGGAASFADFTPAQNAAEQRGDYNLLTRNILRQLAAHATSTPPDVVHLHGCRLGQDWIIEWASAHGYSCVYTEHTTMADWEGPWSPEAPDTVGVEADAIVCVSESARQSLLSILPVPRDIQKTRHIVRGPEQWRASTASAGEIPKVLCVARLDRHKGIDLLINAVAQLRDDGVTLQLTIAGDGAERAPLEQLVAQLGLQSSVSFLGSVAPRNIGALWENADFGVLPSRTEGLPLSLVEAMACGRPVVASRVGGIPEVIENGENGLLFAPEDVDALAQSMRRLIEHPECRRRLALGARHSFETGGWSEEDVTEHTLSILEQARTHRVARTDRVGQWGREAAGDITSVVFVTWGLSAFGDMEHVIAAQASALALAGVKVTVIIDQRAPITNRYLYLMRRAGVRVMAPGLAASLRFRALMTLERMGVHRLPWAAAYSTGALAASCAREKPDAIHVHGWKAGSRWESAQAALSFARERGIPFVYTEHCDAVPNADEGNAATRALREAPVLSAATPGARHYLAAATGTTAEIALLRHAGPARPPAPVPSPATRPFRVLALPGPGEGTALEREVEQARSGGAQIELTCAGGDEPADVEGLAAVIFEHDAILISRRARGFPVLLSESMAAYRAIIVAGDPREVPLHDRADALMTPWSERGQIASAVRELAADPLLAHALGIAARRTFESSGCSQVAIVAQGAALYRSAATHAVAEKDNARG
jgi:glycosyltransferase involved in cell wall biosynthesis